MDIQEILDKAALIEEQMSDFYREVSASCQDKSLSEELMKISQDEIGHMNLLITGKKYASEAPEAFEIHQETEEMIKLGLERIRSLMDMVRNDKSSLEVILNDALWLEKFFSQFHLKSVVNVKMSSLKQLFESLSQDCETHACQLSNIIAKLKSENS